MNISVKNLNMIGAVKLFFIKFVDFKTRSTRKEYWWCFLANFLVNIPVYIINLIIYNITGDMFWLNFGLSLIHI